MGKYRLKYAVIAIAILLAVFVSSCSGSTGNILVPTSEGSFPVDPLFEEFYSKAGGVKVVGPAISPPFTYDNHRYQYVQAGCLEYDPDAPEGERIRFSSIGMDIGISDPAVASPDSADQVYVGGHVIFKGFVPLYRKLGGKRVVGKPLTEAHYNPTEKRFEQFFENLGFFWVETDPAENVRLLAYGVWKCDRSCRHVPSHEFEVNTIKQIAQQPDNLFRQTIDGLGSKFTGLPLTGTYTASDGYFEQILENLVLASNPDRPQEIIFRAVPEVIGITPTELVPNNGIDGMVFWPLDGQLGHNVPKEFVDFLSRHGGIEVSGPPTTELFLVADQVFRQCFKHLCLDYHLLTNVPPELRIQVAPLGSVYKDLYFHPTANNAIDIQSLRAVSIKVWERYSLIPSNVQQEVGAMVLQGDQPLANVAPLITIRVPKTEPKTYNLPPTDQEGKTVLYLDPIVASNGTVVEYDVCVKGSADDLFCVKDSFIIWYNP